MWQYCLHHHHTLGIGHSHWLIQRRPVLYFYFSGKPIPLACYRDQIFCSVLVQENGHSRPYNFLWSQDGAGNPTLSCLYFFTMPVTRRAKLKSQSSLMVATQASKAKAKGGVNKSATMATVASVATASVAAPLEETLTKAFTTAGATTAANTGPTPRTESSPTNIGPKAPPSTVIRASASVGANVSDIATVDKSIEATNPDSATTPSNIGIEGNETPAAAKPSSIADIGPNLLARAKPTSTVVVSASPAAGTSASATTKTGVNSPTKPVGVATTDSFTAIAQETTAINGGSLTSAKPRSGDAGAAVHASSPAVANTLSTWPKPVPTSVTASTRHAKVPASAGAAVAWSATDTLSSTIGADTSKAADVGVGVDPLGAGFDAPASDLTRDAAPADMQATDAVAAEALDATEGAFPTVDDAIEAGLASVTPIGCITDDRQTHSATRTCLTNTPRDAEPF